MSDCSQHKKDLFGETDMKIVAEAIGDLHYETLCELTKRLEVKFWIDGSKDFQSGRDKLGTVLQKASECMEEVSEYIRQAWQISKPHMDK